MMGVRYTFVIADAGEKETEIARAFSQPSLGDPESGSVEEIGLALSQSIWADQFGEPGLFPAPTLTDFYCTLRMST